MKHLTPYLLSLTLCLSMAVRGEPASWSWQNVERVVAVGDVHGAYPALLELLRGNQLIDEQNQWIAGRTHLVSLGDLMDRGDQVRALLDLFMTLQPQAEAAGGRVHVLLGNHELMNLMGDWRDVTDADLQSFGGVDETGVARERHALLSLEGRYGRWLVQQPVMVRINRTLFTHGGLPSMLKDGSLAEHNVRARADLEAVLNAATALGDADIIDPHTNLFALAQQSAESETDPKLAELQRLSDSSYWRDNGPLWYRGSSLCHGLVEADLTRAVLQHFQADAVVVGHSPTWNHQVRERIGGAVWVADTGMLHSVYRGQPLLLEVGEDAVVVRNPEGEAVGHEVEAFTPLTADRLQQETAVLRNATLAQAPEHQQLGENEGQTLLSLFANDGQALGQAWFRPMPKREAGREVAAYVLDRLLGVGMVPITIAAEHQGKGGTLSWHHSGVITEAERQAQARAFSNWCERGNDYQVVTAFDALIGQRQRSAENLGYSHRLTRIHLSDHGKAFGTSRALPVTSARPALSETMRVRLRALTRETLAPHLDAHLSGREQAALLKRRDAIIQWPALTAPTSQ